MLDIEQIRKDFPILSETVYNRPLIYLDNGATTQKPQCVIDRIVYVYSHQNANIHRGVHHLSNLATVAHEEARQTVADFLGAKDKKEIIFTRGTTESVNLVATALGNYRADSKDGATLEQPRWRNIGPDCEIIVSLMEHHSNFVPWQQLCKHTGATLRIVPLTDDGELDMEAYKSMLSSKTAVVAICQVSNVLGTVNPVKEVVRLAHQVGAITLIDGAQAVPHMPVNMQDIDTDFYVFSGHKIYAPNGIGVLYGKEQALNNLPPYQFGGEMIDKVTIENTTFNELPWKFEAGTPDYVGSVALAEAIRYVQKFGMDAIAAHEAELVQYAISRLQEFPNIRIFGPKGSNHAGVISFLVGNIHPYDLGMLLDKLGVAVRTGHHCAEPLIDHYGIPGTVRISFGLYNTKAEIDQFMQAMERVVPMLS